MRTRLPRSTRSLVALAVAATVLATLAVVLAVRGGQDGSTPGNVAFLDTTSTDAVIRDTEKIVTQVFTIDPRRVPATRRAAGRALVGDAVGQYAHLYDPFLARAKQHGLGLRTTTRAIGVDHLTDDRGLVLVLADQTATSPDGRSTAGTAHFELGVVRRDGAWKVTSIEVL